MLELFELLFREKGVSEENLRRFASEFSGLALCAILGEARERWTLEDSTKLEQLLIDNDFDGAYRLAQGKFTGPELKEVLDRKIVPLFENYTASVVM
jgi:hypothetical protein